jgi:hypothetical protein
VRLWHADAGDELRDGEAPALRGVVEDIGFGTRTVFSGADELLAFLQDVLSDVVTVHHCHTPEIEVTSSTTATGVWAMEDMLRWPNGMELHGYGHYHETYAKVDGRWRIKRSTLTRLRMDFSEGAAP